MKKLNPHRTQTVYFEQQRYVFPVQSYTLDYKYDLNYPYIQDHITNRVMWQFMFGTKKLIKQEVVKSKKFITRQPKNTWNCIKSEIVKFCPTLNFGWIAVEYLDEFVDVDVVTNNTYINVVPIEQYTDETHKTMFLISTPTPTSVYVQSYISMPKN